MNAPEKTQAAQKNREAAPDLAIVIDALKETFGSDQIRVGYLKIGDGVVGESLCERPRDWPADKRWSIVTPYIISHRSPPDPNLFGK
ncbi:MAG: hypothetical protein ACYDCF_05395 [Burkholderiales bacterium]